MRGEAESAVSRAIKALNLVVSAGGFGLVIFDAGGVPARALRQLPFTTWLRVQRVLEGSDTACVLLADAPLARSTGGASVRLGAQRDSAIADRPAVPDFHAQVRANRFIGDRSARAPVQGPVGKRRRAVRVTQRVVRAHGHRATEGFGHRDTEHTEGFIGRPQRHRAHRGG